MKILIVHEQYGALAGAEQNILLTAQALTERGHELAIAYLNKTNRNQDQFDQAFKTAWHIGDPTTNPLSLTAELKRILDQTTPDIIYVHKMTILPLMETLIRTGKPLVRMIHDHDTYCLRSYRYSPYTRRICRRKIGAYCLFPCLAMIQRNRNGRFPIKFGSLSEKIQEVALNKQFDNIFVVTEYMKEEFLIQEFDASKIHIFPPVPRPAAEVFESNFSEENIVLYLGQIIRGKGVDCLIRALSKIKTPYKTYIIGSGSHEAACRKLVTSLNLDQKIIFTGWIDHNQLKQFYQSATVVSVPSVWPEPIATIGLEVMRYGLPVVGFDAGGIRDWLKNNENGYLVDWMDIAGLAHGIEDLLLDKTKARKFGQAGKTYVNQHYDFDAYISRMEKQFGLLMKSQRSLQIEHTNKACSGAKHLTEDNK